MSHQQTTELALFTYINLLVSTAAVQASIRVKPHERILTVCRGPTALQES